MNTRIRSIAVATLAIATSMGVAACSSDTGSTTSNAAPEFNDDLKAGAFIAAGLVLFILTFIVNAIARAVIGKKEGAE